MEIQGPSVNLLCIQQSDAALFCENYAKFYFNAKHLEKGLKGVGEKSGSLFGQYQMLP